MHSTLKPLRIQRLGYRLGFLSLLTLLCSGPAWAADPFRTGRDARPIGPSLQSAFEDFFRLGSYQNSGTKLDQAQIENPGEPLVYTLQAALAYQNRQKEQFLTTIPKIREVAQQLEAKDPARSHLYRGIAQGLAGYFIKDKLSALAQTVTYASSMLLEIDKAHQLAPNDPEINLIVGYVNTVLRKYDDAIKNFEKAGPAYLAYRGQALVYRDTKNYPKAQEMVEKALAAAPQNPDLLYLKGQILALQRKPAEAVAFFDQALKLGEQLPEGTKKQILKERNSQATRLPMSSPVPSPLLSPAPSPLPSP
ncbi:MAG: Sll0314/Alr1548 family TPR repeat-containing protein [Thermosynechococcaceae cyanobacterium]